MKSVRKQFSRIGKAAQKGFTLIELVVVVAVIGVLIAIVAPSITGSRDGANAQLLVRSANSIAQNWQMINQQCGTNSAVASSPIGTMTEVVFAGTGINAAYQACYTQSRVLPLTEISLSEGGGNYSIANYPVTITGGGTVPLQVTYNNVPDTLVLGIVQRYDSNVAALPAGASTSSAYTLGAPSGGARTITIIKRI
ncbi:prepilin-type N-terminal cleavage/methylation domain-containing protein [Hydrogenophaga sp. 2FB]|uniref:prepilin-type N-terminal cleavage/methylation domain-containing protein n=1 Tax=Hydrogenophaga sp. 2FB TaxID=2502187 RepID=UPI001484F053|nr:prepilin-type N-terminal cleavage/methylation domain-containing protein [Hydrogenophaga sp. 2FB]